jgi:hypothetical protein
MFGSIYLTVIAFGLMASALYLVLDKKIDHPSQRIFLGILAMVLVLETVGLLTARQRINNSLGYNIGFVYLESLLLIGYFYFMEKSPFFRKIILLVTLFLAVWGMVVSVQLQNIQTEFQYFAFLPFGLFILFLSGRLLSQILNLRIFEDWDLLLLPHFWISTAVLFFYLEALLVFGTYQFNPDFVIANVSIIFGFNRFLAGTMYFVFGFAFFIPLIYERFLQKRHLS